MHVLDSCTYLIFFLTHYHNEEVDIVGAGVIPTNFAKVPVVYFCRNIELCIIQTFEWSLMHILRKHSCHYLELA